MKNNHRKDAKSEATNLPYKHFNEQNYNFQQHAKFTLIERTKKQTISEEIRTLLKQRENFWVLKLKTLYPDGLNQFCPSTVHLYLMTYLGNLI